MSQTGRQLKIISGGVTDDGMLKFRVENVSTIVKENILHGTISFNRDISIASNNTADIDTGFKIDRDLSKYCIIERFSGSWAFTTINKFVGDNGTLMVTVLNPTSGHVTELDTPFTYDWIKFDY